MKETVLALLIVWHSDPFIYEGYIEPAHELVTCDASAAADAVCAGYSSAPADEAR
jgi:hypothetical protein